MDKIKEGSLVVHKLTHEVMVSVEEQGFDYLSPKEKIEKYSTEGTMKAVIVCRRNSGELARFALCELIELKSTREENNEGK